MARNAVAVAPIMRKSGIKILGDLAWGTHFCQFYKTKQDLLEILVPYFKSGLENNELCVWVTSEFLNEKEARVALKKAVPDFSKRFEKGQIEIFPYTKLYLREGKFKMQRVLDQWIKKYEQGIKAGYDGCRVSGNPFWIDNKKDWKDFSEYEAKINNFFGPYKLLMLHPYSLDKCGASEILDVVNNHEFAIIKKFGDWTVVKSSISEKIQKAIQEKNLRYQSLFNALTESFALRELVFDSSGHPVDCRFLDVNSSFEKFIGIERGRIIGKLRHELPVGFNRSSFKIYAQVALTGKPTRFESYSRDLNKYFSVFVYRPAKNQFATIFTDITERKKAEKKLAQSERTYRGLFENVGEMLAIYKIKRDEDGRVSERILVDGNRAMFEATGAKSIEEIRGKTMSEILGNDYANATLGDIRKIIDSGKTGHFQSYNQKNGKSYINTITPLNEKSYIAATKDITEIKKLEETLKASEEKARTILEYAPAMIYEMDFTGQRFISVNDVMCSMLGYTREELMVMRPADLIDEKSKKLFSQRIKQKIESKRLPESVEYRGLTKDGREMYVSVKTTFTYKNGKPATAIVVAHDITQQKKAEEALNRALGQLKLAQQSAGAGIWDWDIVTEKMEWSPELYSLFGLNPLASPASYDIWKNVLHPNDLEMAEDRINTAIKNHTPLSSEYRVVLPNKQVRWINALGNAIYDKSGNPLRMSGICIDITERKKIEKDLRDSEARFRLILKNAPVSVAAQDKNLRFLWNYNQRTVKPDATVGKTDTDLFKPDEARILTVLKRRVLATGKELRQQLWINRNGLPMYLDLYLEPLRDETGQITGIGIATVDMTESKMVQENLDRLNRTLKALNGVNHAILNSKSEKQFLDEVCRIIIQDCGHKLVWIGFTNNDEEKSIKPAAFNGFEDGYLETLNLTWANSERGQGPTGKAVRTGKPHQCKNMLLEPNFAPWREEAIKRGYAASIAIPLTVAGKRMGVITIYSKIPDPFTNDEVKLLVELANDTAYGIYTLRLRLSHAKTVEKLRETGEYLKNLLNYANAPIIVWNPKLEITHFNRAFEILTGYLRQDVLGKKLDFLFPKSTRKKSLENIYNTFKGKRWETVEMPILRKDGAIRTVLWNSATIYDSKMKTAIAAVAQGQDITEQKLAEKQRLLAQVELKKHAEQLEKAVSDLENLYLAVENASDIIFIANPQGLVLSVNKAIESLLGYHTNEIIGKNISVLGHPLKPDFYDKIFKSIKTDKNVYRGVINNVHKNGHKRIFELHISPILGKNGEVIFFIGIQRDCTEAKEIDRAKTEFISMAAHQLRTPLATISMASEMIANGNIGQIDGAAREQIEEIYATAYKMAGLIELFLNISRIELRRLEVNPEIIDVTSFAQELVKEILPQAILKRLDFTTNFESNIPRINIDRRIMHIALENLLTNAIKYTDEGGKINFSIRTKNKSLVCAIADNGRGIPKHQMSLIFTKMFRAANVREINGMGLGLNMAKGMIEESGGKLWLESEEGKGSTFFVSIPLSGMIKKQIKMES